MRVPPRKPKVQDGYQPVAGAPKPPIPTTGSSAKVPGVHALEGAFERFDGLTGTAELGGLSRCDEVWLQVYVAAMMTHLDEPALRASQGLQVFDATFPVWA
jgi:hypothetical protein